MYWKPLPEIKYSSDSSHFSNKQFISSSSAVSLTLQFKYCSSLLVFNPPPNPHLYRYNHRLISIHQPNTSSGGNKLKGLIYLQKALSVTLQLLWVSFPQAHLNMTKSKLVSQSSKYPNSPVTALLWLSSKTDLREVFSQPLSA